MRRTNIALILAALTALAACKKVVNVDLNNATPQIVIEGEVTNQRGPHVVRITRSVPFSSSNVFPPVTNADVYITDSTNGIVDHLSQVNSDSGVYLARGTVGVTQHTYVLTVTLDGKEYRAVSTMPKAVPLDSVTFALNYDFSNKQEINAVVNFQDPPGLGNYYQFTEEVNGRKIPNIFVFEDRLSDGRYIQQPLFNDSAYLKKDDTLAVTMNCVDKNIHDYFFTLAGATSNSFQTATPANPNTNITGGALGYFSAHSSQRTTIIVY